ncbi:MAG TPA: hypothetical protein VN833_17090 [Candidatus Acidoferrales bacterium]|nr:hypothetical protein [Candidatus Acidoferrales bacterium]
MFDVLHSYLNDQIVAPTHQKCSPDLWDRFRLIEESIDYSSLMLGQLDKEKGFQGQTDSSQINIGMSAAEDSRSLEILDPFVTS